MARAYLLLLGVIALTGCDLLDSKVDNPVFGPPPPRISMADPPENSRDSRDREGDGRVRVVDFDATADKLAGASELSGTQVVATVNGQPVFASEILEPFGGKLREARKQITPEQYEELRRTIIKNYLKQHIEQKLLADALRSTLEKEQLERIDMAIDAMYGEHVNRLKKQFKVNSEHEVDLELQKQHDTSLARLKNGFAVQNMAQAYLDGKATPTVHFGRQQLLEYYEEHIADYEYPTKVRWQQITVSFEKNGGRHKALERLEEAVNKLKAGADFGEIAAEYSDAANAKKGGNFDWTQPDSLADVKVREALSTLEPGTISRVLESKDSFRLVLVNERKEAGRQPFEKVQGSIKKKLEAQAKKAAEKKLLDELYADAIVETIFDEKSAETRPIRANVNKPAANAAGVSRVPANGRRISKKSY